MVDVQTISIVIAAASVVAFVVNSILTSRREEKRSQQNTETRQAQLFMDVFQRMMDSKFIESEDILWKTPVNSFDEYKNVMKGNDFRNAYYLIAYWMEGIGVLVRERLIDVRFPSLLYSGLIIGFWGKFGPFIEKSREEYAFPRMMGEAEFLANSVREYSLLHPELKINTSFTIDRKS